MVKVVFVFVLFLQIVDFAKAQSESVETYIESFGNYNPLFLSSEQASGAVEEESLLTRNRSINSKVWLAIGGAGLLTATYFFFDEPVQEFSQFGRNCSSDKVFKWVEPLGRSKYLIPAAGATLIGGLLAKNEKMRNVGVISIGSILANCVITDALKESFRRHRPSVSRENDQFDGPFIETTNGSMPSSHTSTAFALATSVAYVYKDTKIVPPLAYAVATLVGISRIHDNAHWTTDVLAGAAVGYFSSRGVIYLHKKIGEGFARRKQKMHLSFSPIIAPETFGLSSTLKF